VKVEIDKTYAVAAPAAQAWALLQDIESVAACMPGAEITERVDDTHFKGLVKVKVGPASAAFKGDIEVQGSDAGKRELTLLGKGSDTKGSSSASMLLTATIDDAGDGASELHGLAEVTVNGKMASFGGRMMDSIADRILQQFADNFSDRALAMGAGSEAEAAAARVDEKPAELDGLALLWQVIAGFFKRLLGRGGAS
jgi:carbon monoxide dehydrogenase subunit G